ncbi:MAG: response regulator [Leptolyngbyaceae cyanobacterium bins.59]|nr:response regulator [Leptolyngbyaceae cyanobacterium bins.59]
MQFSCSQSVQTQLIADLPESVQTQGAVSPSGFYPGFGMGADLNPLPQGDILIVDDSPANLRMLTETLAVQGHTVRCAITAPLAFMSIATQRPDLILLDIRLPGMDGYTICQKLKANPETRSIPVIFLSALTEVTEIIEAFRVGGVDYITKPFQAEEVLARINSQLTIQMLQKKLLEQNQHLKQEIENHKKTEEHLRQEIQNRILIEAVLQDAKEEAEAASYMKSRFLSKVSHELRTPLNAILGFSEILRSDSSLSTNHQNYLKSISQNGHHLLKLINNILSLTSAELHQMTLNERNLDLYQFLTTLIETWQTKVLGRGLDFQFCQSPDVPRYIRVDEGKLHQVLIHLLENALKFTTTGGISLRVTISGHQPTPTIPCTLIFEVEDTGPGIASEEQDNLFQAFSQTETGRKSEQGLGLGLLLSHQFVQLMGGHIRLTSASNQGTIVRVQLPVHSTIPQEVPQEALQMSELPYLLTEGCTDDFLQATLSTDWLLCLHQAALRGSDEQILNLVQDLPPHQASLARLLTEWTYNFEFDRIEEVTRQAVQIHESRKVS